MKAQHWHNFCRDSKGGAEIEDQLGWILLSFTQCVDLASKQ